MSDKFNFDGNSCLVLNFNYLVIFGSVLLKDERMKKLIAVNYSIKDYNFISKYCVRLMKLLKLVNLQTVGM